MEITYSTPLAAAKAWGAGFGVSGRKGGYLYAADKASYDALPVSFRYGRSVQRASFALVALYPGASGTKAVQGWDSLAALLVKLGRIEQVTVAGRRRFALV